MFSISPEGKGIETSCMLAASRACLGSVLALKEKGLRHVEFGRSHAAAMFSISPEGKGIETLSRVDSPISCRSVLALKEKGLRPLAMNRSQTAQLGSVLALK